MVVCKFFLEGRCRFGDDCKNEHPRGNNQNRFAPLQNQQSSSRNRAGAFGGQSNSNSRSEFSVSADNIKLDLKNTGDGERPIWPFSAYGPGVMAPRQLLEGEIEQSPEEMRLRYYIAQAAGQPQEYVNQEQALLNQVNSQIQHILNNPEDAKRHVVDGQNIHPNRADECTLASPTFPWNNRPKLGQQQSTGGFGQASNGFGSTPASTNTSGFGQPSGLGAQRPAFGAPSAPVSGFGQASALGGFGKPSALGGGGQFGQASALGQGAPAASPFSQAAQQANGFSKPSLPGFGQSGFAAAATAKPAFATPSQPSAFAQPSQPSVFGQPSQPSVFGQPSQPAQSPFAQPSQPAPSVFGQPSQPNAFSGQQQQQQQQQASPFAQPTQAAKPNPFAPASQTQPSASPFATATGGAPKPNPFAQPQNSTPNPFAAKPSTTPANPFNAPTTTQPPTGPFGTTWRATHFHNQPILRSDKGTPCITVTHPSTGKNVPERVWFPDGPVHHEQTTNPAAFHDREALPEVYEGPLGQTLKELYEFVAREGAFKDGVMPEVPPLLEWIDWDC